MALEVRVLRQGEGHLLARVADDVFDDPVDARATELFLADPRHHLAVAIDEGVVVGFASGVHYLHPDKAAPELFVNEVGVAPTHQGRGIARQILEVLFECARVVGCRKAWVLTERANTPAMRLYASVGGQEHEEELVMFDFLARFAGPDVSVA